MIEIDNPDPVRAAEDFGGPVKQCRICGDHFPADTDFWYRNCKFASGLSSECKVCWFEHYGPKRYKLGAPDYRKMKREREAVAAAAGAV